MAESRVEEITTLHETSPKQVVRKVTKTDAPVVETEHPQQVFETKKAIFRSYQVIWYLLGVVESLLAFRFVLKFIGASPASGFASLIYSLSAPLAVPFLGVVAPSVTGTNVFEWSTIIAIIVYFLIAYGVVELFQFIKPVTPEEVEREVS